MRFNGKKTLWRVVGIGLFHMVLYLYIVPFVIYPRFHALGQTLAAVIALMVSVAVLGAGFAGKKLKGGRRERD